jgi:hypothetical protein
MMMAYFTHKSTTASFGGISRKWAGEAKQATLEAWMLKHGFPKCFVSVDAIHKAQGVNVERYTLNVDGSRA